MVLLISDGPNSRTSCTGCANVGRGHQVTYSQLFVRAVLPAALKDSINHVNPASATYRPYLGPLTIRAPGRRAGRPSMMRSADAKRWVCSLDLILAYRRSERHRRWRPKGCRACFPQITSNHKRKWQQAVRSFNGLARVTRVTFAHRSWYPPKPSGILIAC